MMSQCLLGVMSQDLIQRKDGKGRVLAYELMLNNPAIGNVIRRSETHKIDGMLETGKRDGMQHYDGYIYQLFQRGIIDDATAISASRNKQQMAVRVRTRASEGDHE